MERKVITYLTVMSVRRYFIKRWCGLIRIEKVILLYFRTSKSHWTDRREKVNKQGIKGDNRDKKTKSVMVKKNGYF